MTRGARLALGAVFGGLLALAIHPRSRPLMLVTFTAIGPSNVISSTPELPSNRRVLDAPQNLGDASLWMQSGAERLQFRSEMSTQDRLDLVRVADLAANWEPQNGFWKQMGAVFSDGRADAPGALARWMDASRASGWNDHQSKRLVRVAQELEQETGAPFSWHLCRAYSLRSLAAPRSIETIGRRMLASEAGRLLELRLATLRNGVLLRDGARSLLGSESGVSMIEAAAHPGSAAEQSSPRKLLLARLDFANAMREEGREIEAEEVMRAYLADDAFLALTSAGRASRDFQLLARISLSAAVVPSALICTSIIGWVLVGIAAAMKKWPRARAILQPPLAPLVGVVAGLAAYALTGLTLLGLAIALCFAFLVFGPHQARSRPPSYLGPFFRFTILVLSSVFVLLVGTYFATRTTPIKEMLPILDPPLELLSVSIAPLGLAALILGTLLLVGPSWGMVLRLRTDYVVLAALTEFGRFVAWGCLGGAVLLAPIALVIDAQISDPLNKLILNEPTFYLIR